MPRRRKRPSNRRPKSRGKNNGKARWWCPACEEGRREHITGSMTEEDDVKRCGRCGETLEEKR